MAQLNIVLVEPEIPQNTGNIARTCAATGARLHIVRPMGFTPTDKHLKRAGLDYWHLLDITYYDNLDDFLKRTETAAFTTFRLRQSMFIRILNTLINVSLFSERKRKDCRRDCFLQIRIQRCAYP